MIGEKNVELLQGDCLVESKKIKSGSVDLILTDLPYGNMKGIKLDGFKRTDWDNAIDSIEVHNLANRILRMNGKMILFSQEPYTTRLITEAIPNLPFNYRAIWEKDHFANCLGANKNMVSFYEDVLVFSKKYDHEALHPLRAYFKMVMEYIGLNLKQINNKLGHRRAEHTFYVTPKKAVKGEIGQKADHTFRTGSTQFALCTESTYNELIQVFGIDKMQGFKTYAELKSIDLRSTFNLWEGNKYKSNILKYKKDYQGLHPAQKPVALLEDLIKTFSNEGDTVVDLTMGSGSTGVACKNTGRSFIGIEMDDEYFGIAKERIETHEKQLSIFNFDLAKNKGE